MQQMMKLKCNSFFKEKTCKYSGVLREKDEGLKQIRNTWKRDIVMIPHK